MRVVNVETVLSSMYIPCGITATVGALGLALCVEALRLLLFLYYCLRNDCIRASGR